MLSSISTVLVVDDDEVVGGLLQEVLEDEGYQVERAADGQHAMSRIYGGHLDAVLLDLRVPMIDGLQVLKIVRAAERDVISHLPVMLLSAMASDADHQAALEAGADDYLAKPFDLDVLLERLQGLLRRHLTNEVLTSADAKGGPYEATARTGD
jgi:two-component system response regulator MprA